MKSFLGLPGAFVFSRLVDLDHVRAGPSPLSQGHADLLLSNRVTDAQR